MHPDGRRVAFVVSRMDLTEDRYLRTIWVWDGAQAAAFTDGLADTAPRWSPDGSKLAFLRGDEKGERPQVAVMAAEGGECVVLTDLDLGFERLEWSPDGSRLAGLGSEYIGGWSGLEDEERKRRPKRIDRYPYRFDTRGWLHDRRRHVYLVDPEGEAPLRCLTPGEDFEETDFVWRQDSAGIAFCSARHPDRGLEPGVSVYELDVLDGEPLEVVPRGLWSLPTYSQDGTLHLIGDPDPWGHPTIFAMWRVEPDGSLADLTGHLDRNVHWILPATAPDRPHWVGDAFLAIAEDSGRLEVRRFTSEGRDEIVVGGERQVTGVSPSTDGSALAFVATTPTDPGELYWWENGEDRVLTDLNGGFRAEAGLVEPHAFEVSSDGQVIHGWIYLPRGNEQVPAVLNIHGGPASQYGHGFFDEFQVYARHGYGVVACNPRGSTGRGREFVRAVTGDGWGDVDLADVTAFVEGALEAFPRLDRDRLGVMGGSYGGFLTAWLISHDHRYRSAIVERALLSWESFAGTSDIGATFSRYYLGTDVDEGRDLMAEKSPLTFARKISTPTLILHSEDDFRCPIEQAEQLFMAILRAGTEVELLRFPGEGHELSRSGKPRHRLERFEAVLDWHDRHLTPP